MPSGYSAWAQRAGITPAEKLAYYSRPAANGCRVWVGQINKRFGYAQVKIEGRTRRANRVTWEEKVGPIPRGLMVCHRCDNRACVEITHLFLGTARDNTHDMIAKGRQARLRGEMGGNAKLSEPEARSIIADARPHKEIAAAFGIHVVTVSKIKSGSRWGHLQ